MVFSRESNVPTPATAQVVRAAEPSAVRAAAAAAARGELIVLPTDTVYGVATSAFDEGAIRRLFLAKRRPWDKGIPILIADVAALDAVAREVPRRVGELVARFWPGPLTIILPKRSGLPEALSQSDTIAVRIPDHDVCRMIIRTAGGALAATSANLSGHPPAVTADMALTDLAGYITVALDAGPSPMQQASTVVDCTKAPWRILRPGPLAADAILSIDRE
jgi:L-threonylcarbamoyladenylate synthase